MITPGEDGRWGTLLPLLPTEVCQRAAVDYDKDCGAYVVKSFGMLYQFTPQQRQIVSRTIKDPQPEMLLTRFAYFYRLASLWYLTGARELPPSNHLVPPEGLKDGGMFFKGGHTLPLDKLAARFGADRAGFLQRGIALGGEEVSFGDVAIRVYPFPRVPVVLILWLEDDEFPARVNLLFDSTCEFHLPLDMNWNVAMMCVLMMLA
ncbi:hypothetical protein MBAV_003604 [Candidatus Magnetobacterium bavaricum]|uniref:DUF3786 domain-containing protein n=1 Tax=Candidatus Magnetobacterium bavaricum TaxID=29290 RepID=A0A0F3GQE0_9BACT|nr:hypothetical protein MBAV_003604 [Candidatus Magnetobacterium bavaricum]